MDYKVWLKSAEDRLATLKQQRAAIDAEISKLEQGIKGFKPLVEEPGEWSGSDVGVTEGIRQLLKANPNTAYEPTEIRDELLNRGIVLGQKNPMAVIHQVLSRLTEGHDVQSLQLSGNTCYRWLGHSGRYRMTTATARKKT